jgi:hypothetical protein
MAVVITRYVKAFVRIFRAARNLLGDDRGSDRTRA